VPSFARISRVLLLLADEFSLRGLRLPLCGAHTSLSPLAVQMAYYFGSLRQIHLKQERAPLRMLALIHGPEGNRTLDLLNAIETRSQLRHRPNRTRKKYTSIDR
jgi:hypothetical protein